MGVFSKSKKVKEVDYVLPEDAGETSGSKISRSLKRKPKQVVAPKPEINLAMALPETNDFRISLMMPQLSARFSMLREQDDPTTKVGKANDDSVLFPKRASRMNLFAHNPLTDIAEVESIHSTIKPPFARGDRSYSLSDAYASDDGASIMGRSKPGEGNNLFGGRQKMYRMPAAGESARTLTDSQYQGSGMGKHVYEDDVSLSVFQKYRMEAREQERRASSTPEDEEEADAVNSPMTAFSKNRGTQSSTASGPSNRRTSTAATSLTSESPIPRQNSHGFGSKGRTSDSVNGSDESLIKQNPSSESRKNFPFRDGATQPPVPFLGKTPSQSRSAANLNEKYSRPGMFASGTFRAVSPPPVSNAQAIASLDLGLQDANQRVASPTRRYQLSSPSSPSPVEDDMDHVYNSSLQPNDRGKATAMGLFNRPRQQFDEQQFVQRQRTMLEGRSSPFPADGRSESRASPETTSSAMQRIDAALASDRESSASVPPLNTRSPNTASSPQPKDTRNFYSLNKPDIVTRPRNQSSLSSGSETVDVKSRVENMIRDQNAELAALEAKRGLVTESYRGSNISHGPESLNPSSGTFFNNVDASEDEAEQSPQRDFRPRVVPTDIHPALRNGTHGFDFGENVSTTPRTKYRESNVSNASNTQPMTETTSGRDNARKPSQAKCSDSPTLGPNGLGLSGMIRSHLRHDSDRSSVYPPSPGVPTFPQREVSMASTHTINPPESVHSDPWEFDSASRNQVSSRPESHTSELTPTMSQRAQQAISHSQRQGPSKAQQILGHEAPNGSKEIVSARSWHDELPAHHRRGDSTETQKEREDFDNELAERQRRIQEKLKGVAEQELRSRSPMGRQDRAPMPQAFHTLKQKASMGNMAHAEPPNAQPKAMKMLGLTSRDEVPMRSSNPGRPHEFDNVHSRPAPSQLTQRLPPPVDSNYRNVRTPADGRPPVDPHANRRRTPAEGRGAMDPYASGRRTPGEGRAPVDPYASGRRTPGEGRGAIDPYASGRRTPAEGRGPMDQYASGRRTPAGGRQPMEQYANGRRVAEEQSQYPDGSSEDFDRHRQRSATPNSERPRKDRATSNAAEGSRSRQGHYRNEYGYPPMSQRHGQTPSSPDFRSHRGGPTPDPYERAPSAASVRPRNGSRPPQAAYLENRMPPPQSPLPPHMNLPPGGGPPRPSPRPPFLPSPMSGLHGSATAPSAPFANPNSTSNSALSSPVLSTNTMADPRGSFGTSSGRTTRDRKKSVTRGMISEPLFVSSTSSVPLVDLPNGIPSPRPQPISSPPVPAMNPRRRAPTPDLYVGSQSAQPSPSLPMSPLSPSYESSGQYAHPSQYAVAAAQHAYTSRSGPQYVDENGTGGPGKPPPRARNRLRKTSSEGGNMASRARQQAFMAEMGKENQTSPRVPIFPNRSATSLGMAQGDGGMF
jgi:hypothetical protein